MKFEKWQALGNDYLILERSEVPFDLDAARVRRLCDPHIGVGSDGVLLLSAPDDPEFVARLRIFNPDGSEAELSGNGAREAVLYLRQSGWTEEDEFAIETAAGPMRPTITGPTTCRMALGRAATSSPAYPSGDPSGRGSLEAAGRTWSFQHVSIGNPQCAIRMTHLDELEGLDLAAIGPAIENHELFPQRTNVSWYSPLANSDDRGSVLRARIFERGVGETMSSGTGATGAAVAHVLAGGTSPVAVRLDGGELEVGVSRELDVDLTGWAVPVYRGVVADELLVELREGE